MTIERILVGVDDSEGSRNALAWAANLAAALGARVIVAHVFEPLAHLAEVTPQSDLRGLRERVSRKLEGELCAPLVARGIPHEARLVEGSPPNALADLAEAVGADLIVVASRRQPQLRGLLLGSTAARLAGLTRLPVVLIHPGAAAAGG